MKQTPYWTKKKQAVKLSTADKVCLVLKLDRGSWRDFIAERKQAVQDGNGHEEDLERAIRLRDFERENKIRFKQDGGNLCDFYWTPVKRK